jgi:hypothetical protein
VAVGCRPRPRRIGGYVGAIWALRLKLKPRPRLRPRKARLPRLPRGAVALELLLRSSAVDTMSRVLVFGRRDLVRCFVGIEVRFLL